MRWTGATYVKEKTCNSKLSKIKIKNLPINGLGEERGRKMSSDFLCALGDLGD